MIGVCERWGTAINLGDSAYAANTMGKPLAFETDRKGWDAIDRLVYQPGKRYPTRVAEVTVIGIVDVVGREPDGSPMGFGHLGVLPAQMVVHRLVDAALR